MATVADLVIAQLRAAGSQVLFGVPGGGGNLDLIEAAGRVGMPFVLTSTETAGAIAALAQSEVSGCCGACLTTLGPGAASVINGVACAYLDRAPLLVFTDNYAPSTHGVFEHQRLDNIALLRPITKWSTTLVSATAADTINKALGIAVNGCPGPVHLDCPDGVVNQPVDPVRLSETGNGVSKGVEQEMALRCSTLDPNFDRLVSNASRPLLLVGLGARRNEDAIAIRELCARRNVPAMVTYKAKGVVPDSHPLFAGVFTNAQIERDIINESDLLIGIGLDPVELIPRPWKHPQPIIYCGRWPVEDRHLPFTSQLIGDIPSAVQRIESTLQRSAWNDDKLRARVQAQRAAICGTASGMTAQHVVKTAARTLAPHVRVTVDAGAHMFPSTLLWPADLPNQMLISNGLSTMGFALPAAIGAAMADRQRPVVALTGDGGLLMCAGELLTAARENLRIIVIVFNDESLSLIEVKQKARHYQPAGVALGEVRWSALAESLGVPAHSVRTARDLERVTKTALDGSGPTLIDARIDRADYGIVLRAIRG